MNIVAVSDLHGQLPATLPECDLLAVAGDICPTSNHDPRYQVEWLRGIFTPWIKEQPAKHKVLIAGNHDFIFAGNRRLVPGDLGCIYLEDSGVELDGLKVWGSPWQPVFHDWAFNACEETLKAKWALIPDDTDLLVLHGPPRGYGDLVPPRRIAEAHEELRPEGIRTGSPSLLQRIKQVKPRAAVFGHIHEGHGIYDLDGIILANVSMVDGHYRPIHAPTLLRIEPRGYGQLRGQ
jgi:Icc-related predicted phosphoesterase